MSGISEKEEHFVLQDKVRLPLDFCLGDRCMMMNRSKTEYLTVRSS